MTLLDDHVDDLLQSFRADEGRLDDATRARMWARICEVSPEAPVELDRLDPFSGVRRLRRRANAARPRGRVLAIAAAVLALLAVAGVVIRTGPAEDPVTAGPPTTVELPRNLQELAHAVVDLPATVLGEPGAEYTYRRGLNVVQGPDGGALSTVRNVQWVGLDGSGRELATGTQTSDQTYGPDALTLGLFAPDVAIGLTDDVDALAAVVEQERGVALSREVTPGLVEALTFTGIPGPARAGILRALDRLGFTPVPAPTLGPNLLRVEGPGPDGSTMQADLDLRTGQAVATARSFGDGSDRLTSIEVDLRQDTQGS